MPWGQLFFLRDGLISLYIDPGYIPLIQRIDGQISINGLVNSLWLSQTGQKSIIHQMTANSVQFLRDASFLKLTSKPTKKPCKPIPIEEKKTTITHAILEITAQCNMRCKHCYLGDRLGSGGDLDYLEVESIIDQLRTLKVGSISITGGEPLLRPDILRIIRKASSGGLKVTLLTNGFKLSEEIIEDLALSKVENISISLDGATPETHDKIRGLHGSFYRAIDAIRKVKSAGIKCIVSSGIMNYNFSELERIVQLSRELQADKLRIGFALRVGRARENSDAVLTSQQVAWALEKLKILGVELYQHSSFMARETVSSIEPGYLRCRAGYTQIFIQHDGIVAPCPMIQDKRFILGNLRNERLEDILQYSPAMNLLHLVNKIESVPRKCARCDLLSKCRGGCLARTIHESGKIGRVDSLYCQVSHFLANP